MGQDTSLLAGVNGAPITLSDDMDAPEVRAEKYLALQKHFQSLSRRCKQGVVRAERGDSPLVRAAASGHAREVARLAAAAAPGHELDRCNHVRWNDQRPLSPCTIYDQLSWYSVLHVCAVLGHADEMDAVLEAWVPRGLIWGEVAAAAGRRAGVPAARWLLDYACGPADRTPMMLAVANGQAEVVRRLMGRWGAAGRNLVGPVGTGYYKPIVENRNILHLAVHHGVLECIEVIMSGVDEILRAKLVGMKASHVTPLELAMNESSRVNLDLIKVLADPKWGESVIQAMDSRWPILYFSKNGCRGDAVCDFSILNHLCRVFSRGLAAAYLRAPNKYRHTIASHPMFAQSIDEISPKTGDTALYEATIKGDTDVALEALSFGADPNLQCRRNPKWCDFPEELRTPIVMAIASEQKELVKEMARHGGILPLAFCKMVGDSAFSLESYIDGTWEKHVSMNNNFRKSLPAANLSSELRGSMPAVQLPFVPLQIEFTPGAQIQIDISLTQLMIQFNTEITGVMELLDIQSLGRVQQTSRFWYQCGRTNDLWRRALFNSSREWSQRVRHKVDKCLESLPEATTKWKHICFFWVSKNRCLQCHKLYRNCIDDYPTTTPPTTSALAHHTHHSLNVRFSGNVSSLLNDILQAT
ncbi:hypothetical protein Pelo_16833 [Pelomyxa schiedti]|nr:hypothetical protein Pelo_16833 [Pelomyxa schiedti]